MTFSVSRRAVSRLSKYVHFDSLPVESVSLGKEPLYRSNLSGRGIRIKKRTHKQLPSRFTVVVDKAPLALARFPVHQTNGPTLARLINTGFRILPNPHANCSGRCIMPSTRPAAAIADSAQLDSGWKGEGNY